MMKYANLIFVSLFSLFSTVSSAQAYPERAIRFIVPFNPGGGQDILIRHVTPKVGDILGQQIVVENRPGAAGTLGALAVANAKPDGYTIGLGSSSTHAANVSQIAGLSYDPVTDFEPVALLAEFISPLVVTASLPVNSVEELIQLLKAHPGKYNYASAGQGSPTRFKAILFNQIAGVDTIEIPYSGSAPALVDLVAGRVALMFDGIAATAPLVKAKKLKILAISAPQRLPEYPDVPTLDESGVKGINANAWAAVFAPAGTPQPIVEKLNAAFNQAINDPAIRTKLTELGYQPYGNAAPPALRAFVTSEISEWARLSKLAGIAAK
ncbi:MULTISPECIES: tripartite tricarboxylate transporter substrate binding protein [unclassified Brenneria]|uniref:Bug family tripartite tricarboxylate transporter substrate binding protein n=1 Tax=unclassified Brenneria TaxID=2634434 RepID=UPI0029C4BEE0|nr:MULTISPECIES: tripartite tricarboxylate transporter substrate binding protein [unclassified Brenneria]MDX5630857.1 tripartite tricarboxylate transporter substrate binding protein [Brenneria sp. L3-3Z]MDX5697939.1 tripartite tricarboxylate transporter substrate binding protein [Brenneria sp. L4-2C]